MFLVLEVWISESFLFGFSVSFILDLRVHEIYRSLFFSIFKVQLHLMFLVLKVWISASFLFRFSVSFMLDTRANEIYRLLFFYF